MSWMDSWSRPSKHAATPPPIYLTRGDAVPYCHSCGRVIGARKSQSATEIKYCSTRCRNNKPGPIDRQIEAAFAIMLNGGTPDRINADQDESVANIKDNKSEKKPKKKAKGDARIIIECSEVEAAVFGHEKDPEKVFGRRKNRAARGVQEKPEDWKSVDMVDDPVTRSTQTEGKDSDAASDVSFIFDGDDADGGVLLDPTKTFGGGKVRPPQAKSAVNGSVGGEKGWAERIEETDEMKLKRRVGQRKAEEREMVRKAARRGCAFGFIAPQEFEEKKHKDSAPQATENRRKCEAVMKGAVVEASYAKGEWAIRWREKT
ncbi:hypothetical protein K504DRAFT_480275 [Pleomassaria siparia CBS 279.74]|uniref:Uncharacterized protein n=1 Tax=Pleomassaria siparia CBS 279.74 TaxID=1314801 RepID=A0A6G1KJZ5_9PLEO|nr:hypothetical protein K504DRAFT_480275 [Pleomassaria siparia CBS 279.74]